MEEVPSSVHLQLVQFGDESEVDVRRDHPSLNLSFWPSMPGGVQRSPAAVVCAGWAAYEKHRLALDDLGARLASHGFLGEIPVVAVLVDRRQIVRGTQQDAQAWEHRCRSRDPRGAVDH